jgi:hypothetical protein
MNTYPQAIEKPFHSPSVLRVALGLAILLTDLSVAPTQDVKTRNDPPQVKIVRLPSPPPTSTRIPDRLESLFLCSSGFGLLTLFEKQTDFATKYSIDAKEMKSLQLLFDVAHQRTAEYEEHFSKFLYQPDEVTEKVITKEAVEWKKKFEIELGKQLRKCMPAAARYQFTNDLIKTLDPDYIHCELVVEELGLSQEQIDKFVANRRFEVKILEKAKTDFSLPPGTPGRLDEKSRRKLRLNNVAKFDIFTEAQAVRILQALEIISESDGLRHWLAKMPEDTRQVYLTNSKLFKKSWERTQ